MQSHYCFPALALQARAYELARGVWRHIQDAGNSGPRLGDINYYFRQCDTSFTVFDIRDLMSPAPFILLVLAQ